MNIDLIWPPLLLAMFGSLLQELIHWYRLRSKLHLKTFKSLLSRPSYWILISLMAVGSGAGVVIWFYEQLNALSPRDFLLLGAAFPALFRQGVEAAISQTSVTLGSADKHSTISAYFLKEK